MVTLRRKASKDKGNDADKAATAAAAADQTYNVKPTTRREPPPTPPTGGANVKEEIGTARGDSDNATAVSSSADVTAEVTAIGASETQKSGHIAEGEKAEAGAAVTKTPAGGSENVNLGETIPQETLSAKSVPDSEDKGNTAEAATDGGGGEASTPRTATVKPEVGSKSGVAAAAGGPPAGSASSQASRFASDGAAKAGQAGQTADAEDDSSDDDGDGFRIVVGRERDVAPAPAAPVKRFLRGTNTLVNTSSAGSTGETRGATSTTKPVSAAAGIASLVPSKGASVTAARPLLKPGEYPPTAELQRAGGRSAFDVDIDGMEEQPWRHPGVDIADFFNYGFTEDSWRVYCEKQLRNRFDQFNRVKPMKTGGVGPGSHARHGAGVPRRGGPEPPRPMQPHNNGPLGRANFPLPGSGAPDTWGPGPRPGPVAQGQFGPGPPVGLGRGSGPGPWLNGPGPPQMYPGGGPTVPPGPGGGQGRGGDMGQWNGSRQGGGFRPQDSGQRDSRIAGSQDSISRVGGNSLMDGSGAGGVKRNRSPTPPRRAY